MSDLWSNLSSLSVLHVCEQRRPWRDAQMRRLVWAFAGRLRDPYRNLMSWLKSCDAGLCHESYRKWGSSVMMSRKQTSYFFIKSQVHLCMFWCCSVMNDSFHFIKLMFVFTYFNSIISISCHLEYFKMHSEDKSVSSRILCRHYLNCKSQ